MILSICIPTYNRDKYLKKNLQRLVQFINELNEENSVDIFVLDNCSKDNTRKYVEEIEKKGVNITYVLNEKNLGIGGNQVKAFTISDSDYFMTLGDDDYLSLEYLREVLNIIRVDNPQMILGNCIGVDERERYLFGPREEVGPTIKENDYRAKVIMALELAHNLSGLVFKKIEMTEELKSIVMSTIYPTIYLTMQIANEGEFVHILQNPINVICTNHKTWKYDISGCLFETLSGMYYLPISKKEKAAYESYAVRRKLVTEGRMDMAYKHPIKLIAFLFHQDRLERAFKYDYLFLFIGKVLNFYKDMFVGKVLKIKKE